MPKQTTVSFELNFESDDAASTAAKSNDPDIMAQIAALRQQVLGALSAQTKAPTIWAGSFPRSPTDPAYEKALLDWSFRLNQLVTRDAAGVHGKLADPPVHLVSSAGPSWITEKSCSVVVGPGPQPVCDPTSPKGHKCNGHYYKSCPPAPLSPLIWMPKPAAGPQVWYRVSITYNFLLVD